MNISELQNIKNVSEVIDFNGLEINIKKHIPEDYKLYIANNIKEIIFGENVINSTDDSELMGNELSNKSLKHSLFVLNVIKFYTDIEIDVNDIISVCNLVVESGLYGKLISIIPPYEINSLNTIINEVILEEENKIKERNNFENFIKDFLTKLSDKLPTDEGLKDVIDKLPKIINDSNPENLKFIADAIAFNNGILPNRQQRRKNEKKNKSIKEKEESL